MRSRSARATENLPEQKGEGRGKGREMGEGRAERKENQLGM